MAADLGAMMVTLGHRVHLLRHPQADGSGLVVTLRCRPWSSHTEAFALGGQLARSVDGDSRTVRVLIAETT